ncbi:MAG: hypothetical protein FWF11_01730 [Coriobacteriia bacterium]|nr:hypothetical protein [Coriobacteriia bacterium]
MNDKNLYETKVFKGELNMKKTFIVLALAFALVLSFSAIAGANEWKGFSPLNPGAAGVPGFVGWNVALATMAQNSVPATMQATAHGGYTTSTTKCSVCHSLHRAPGVWEGPGLPGFAAGRNNQYYLTAGGDSCTVCHTAWGAMTTSKLVEWAVNGVGAGPHNEPGTGGCVACHCGGIHGGGMSDFHVMNVFMLGGKADDQIEAEMNVAGQAVAGRFVAPVTATTPRTAQSWWANGLNAPAEMGSPPGTVAGGGGMGTTSHATYAFARSLATGATCGMEGCHVYSVFANNQWGTGFNRIDPSDDATIPATVALTGHAVPAGYGRENAGIGCGPCHPGSSAGLPTAGNRHNQWRQHGCNQCHDMVGVATNSIAFPHGNRNIRVYEWTEGVPASGAPTVSEASIRVETTVTEGNLWMYTGNLARRAGAGSSSAAGNIANYATTEWRVMTGVTSGARVPGTSGLQDGACLKCHIATDELSLRNTGPQGAFMDARGFSDFANRGHGWNAGRFPSSVPGSTNPNDWATGSARMHLYR